MQLPSTRQLRYLVALAEHQHFGRAAAACFVTQSAFSVGIRELEALLSVQLADRTNRQVTMTRLGQELVAQARLCLQDLESLVEIAQGGREPLAGRFHLGVIPTIAPFVLPSLLPLLRQQYPQLQLYVKEDRTARLHQELMAGTLDMLLIALPAELRNTDALVLFTDPFLLAYREGTQLIDPENYRPSRLKPDTVLLLEEGHCLRDHAVAACGSRSQRYINPFSASSLLTLVQMVDSDLGVTFLPRLAQQSGVLDGTRVRTRQLGQRSFREIALVSRKGAGRSREKKLLAELVRTAAGVNS